MSDDNHRIRELFKQGTPIVDALRRGAQIALWKHKQLGNPVPAWKDGQVVWIPPDKIEVDDPRPLPPYAADF
ncbi:MAG: hypothetical protein AB7K24_22490 [Gemmataceae bacterium]